MSTKAVEHNKDILASLVKCVYQELTGWRLIHRDHN